MCLYFRMLFEEGWHLLLKRAIRSGVFSALCVLQVPTEPTNSFHDKPAKPPTTSSSDPSVTRLRCFAKVTFLEANRIVEGDSLMPQYTPSASIAPPWSASMSMQASIILDQPGNVSFTNLDVISGRVVVRCSKSVDISTIVVKLEGESRTRLMSAGGPDGERPKPQLEYHKVRNPELLMMLALTNCRRFCTRCRWSFHPRMSSKGETGRHLGRVPTHCRLARMNIPGSLKWVSCTL